MDPPYVSAQVPISPNDKWQDVIRFIEVGQGWAYDYDERRFHTPTATHLVDSPDPAGRAGAPQRLDLAPRAMVSIQVRFVSASSTLALDQFGVDGQFVDLAWSLPSGVSSVVSNLQSRTSQGGVVDASSQNHSVVATTMQSYQAGVTLTALAGLLPGDRFRLDSTLTVSAFVGSGLDQTSVTVPLECDGGRGKWLLLYRQTNLSVDVSLLWSRALHLSFQGGGSEVRVYVRVL